MMVAIASDLHDNQANWQRFNDYAAKQGLQTLLFCGDLAGEMTLDMIRREFKGMIYLISGNAETYEPSEIIEDESLRHLGRFGRISIAGKRIGLIHEPAFKREILAQGGLDYLFYGHTHQPWIEQKEGLISANPGTLGGVGFPPTFAVLDTDTGILKLVRLDTI